MAWPYVFANLGGNVPAAYLDDNFNAAVQLGGHTNSTFSGSLSGTLVDLTPTQAYTLLKTQIPWEFAPFQGGAPGSGWIVGAYQPSTGISIVQGSCYATAGTASTGNVSFPIASGNSTIGNVTFTAGNVTGSVVLNSSPQAVALGTRIKITAPASADATLADINFTLGGVRT